jgi:uncharacterized protein (TIGR02266 family)
MARRTPAAHRRFRRRTLRVLVDYTAADGVHCEYGTTLGAGGLFIETEEPLATGASLKVRFRLPEGQQVHEVEGRVVWRQEPDAAGCTLRAPGMGIEFTDAVATSRLARELQRLS